MSFLVSLLLWHDIVMSKTTMQTKNDPEYNMYSITKTKNIEHLNQTVNINTRPEKFNIT